MTTFLSCWDMESNWLEIRALNTARNAGLHVDTIRRGREELDGSLRERPADRVRAPGGGRPALEKKVPAIVPALLSVVEPRAGGDPMGRTKFVRRSLRTLAAELAARGFSICATSAARLLRRQGYSPRINDKWFTGPAHPGRDRQFLNIQDWVEIFTAAGLPILSVDGKKKELIGDFKNAGAAWRRDAEKVNVYDLLAERGYVRVGTSSDTPASAVEAIEDWRTWYGRRRYPGADEVLILADGGGSNGHRPRLWRVGGGGAVTACLDRNRYPTKVKVSNAQMKRLDIERHEFHPDWNYTISPRRS